MKLSVCCITYNHEKFIRKTLDGFLQQKTGFEFEIVIGEDCSTDATRAICEAYKEKYPDKIRLLESTVNLGMSENFLRTIGECKGEYIALCEGDDYWVHPLKLQMQVDFLEENAAFSLCCHDVYFKIKNKNRRSYHWDAPEESNLDYLLKQGNYLTTLSAVFRNHPAILPFLKQFKNPPLGDYLLYVGAAMQGKIKFFRQKMGVYRVHSGGVWSQLGMSGAFAKVVSIIDMLYDTIEAQHQDSLRIQVVNQLDSTIAAGHKEILVNSPELAALLHKMDIPPFLLKYLLLSGEEKLKPSFYSKRIPASLLIGALKQKIKNRLMPL